MRTLTFAMVSFCLWSWSSFASAPTCEAVKENIRCQFELAEELSAEGEMLILGIDIRTNINDFYLKLANKKAIKGAVWPSLSYVDTLGHETQLFLEHDATLFASNGQISGLSLNISKVEGELPSILLEDIAAHLNNVSSLPYEVVQILSEDISRLSSMVSEEGIRRSGSKLDITQLLKKSGIEASISKKLPGNRSRAYVRQGSLAFADPDIAVDLHFQADAKDRFCIELPWPISENVCTTPWRINTHIGLQALVTQKCVVHSVELEKWGTRTYGLAVIVEPLLHLAFNIFKGMAESHVTKALNAALRAHPELGKVCNRGSVSVSSN